MNKEGKEFLTPEQRKAMKEGEIESNLDIDFGALLEERRTLREKKPLRYLHIMELLEFERGLTEEEVNHGWEGVVKRITEETGAFNELKETGILYNLTGGIENGKYRIALEFVEEESERMEKLRKIGFFTLPRNRAYYDDETSTIFIKGKPPSKRIMWKDIASFARFLSSPESVGIESAEHELIHVLQWTKERRRRFFIQELIKRRIYIAGVRPGLIYSKRLDRERKHVRALGDVQAYSAEAAAGFKEWPPSKLIEHLKEGYGFHEIDVLISGIIEIERLRALGLDNEEIGKLVGIAKWDKKTATFPLLEKEIEKLAKEKGLDIEDVDNLVLAKRIQREIEFEKARIIAQEELRKVAQEKGLLPEEEEK